MSKVTILGSGTCNLVPEKAAASVLIEKDNLRLVYDFGRGTAIRLTEAGLRQDDVEYIFISHFHPDHVTDILPYLHAASWSQIDARTKDIAVYGPPGLRIFLDKLLSAFDVQALQRQFKLVTHEIEPNGELSIDGVTLQTRDLHHSFGLRLDGVAIAGDSKLHDDLIALLNKAKLAVVDAGHITDDEICQLAVRTQAQTLVCSHQYRGLDQQALQSQAKQLGYQGQLVVADDLQVFSV